jgi:translation initiation factor IF-1
MAWAVHARVLVRPELDSFWYPGTVRHADGGRYYVILDNQDDGWFIEGQLKPLALAAGTQVAIDGSSSRSQVGVVESMQGSTVQVRTGDGAHVIASLASIRVPESPLPFMPRQRMRWGIGDRVLARWGGDLFWYPGTIYSVGDCDYSILFDDQDQAVVPPGDVTPLEVQVGDKVFCRPKFEASLRYFPAEVTRIAGEVIDVLYEDSEEVELNTSISRIRIRRESGKAIRWNEGDRVLVFGRDEFWYPAQILSVDGDRTFASFFDGRHGWLKPEEVRPLRLIPGMQIDCRKVAGEEYQRATIDRAAGDVLQVTYEDGTSEQTLVRLVRVPGERP